MRRCAACVMIMLRDAKPVPSDTWKVYVSGRNIVTGELPGNWYQNVSNGQEKKDALNLPATAN